MNLQANALFACDALVLLERLPSEAVSLAYLDPPWNTSSDSKLNIDSESQLNTAKSRESSDEQYALYLSKVVQQIGRVLTSDGSLFVHWSPASPMDMRLIMNQAFGDQPKYEITWPRKRNVAMKGPRATHEYITVYCKSDAYIYNRIFRPLSTEEKAGYRQRDNRGLYLQTDLTVPSDRPAAQFVWRGYQLPARRAWRFPLDKLEALALDDLIHFPPVGGLPRLKRYLDDHAGVEVDMIWKDIPSVVPRSERLGFAIQKPVGLMERIVQLASNEGDQVLDPRCGSGTTLIAAHSLGRHWWGADSSPESNRITIDRLAATCGLEAKGGYAIFTEADVMELPVEDITYRDVIPNIAEIAKLQQDVSDLTYYLLALKRMMNIDEDDEEGLEKAIEQMEHWITVSVANQSKSLDSYISVVTSWLTGWERLDTASQSFLPQAELLFENISQTGWQDYSPFIIQYCRALENELLTKLFVAYTANLHERHKDIDAFLAKDLKHDKTGKFAKFLQKSESRYTLGDMNFIMGLMKAGGKTLATSELLKDFRNFVISYFNECILDKAYLDQIDRINKDFRCKAAHPSVLDATVAERCRDQVRTCIKDFILSYKGGESNNE